MSHKGFLQQCIRDKIIPVGLQINLTPTIGKYNDEFVENGTKDWKSSLLPSYKILLISAKQHLVKQKKQLKQQKRTSGQPQVQMKTKQYLNPFMQTKRLGKKTCGEASKRRSTSSSTNKANFKTTISKGAISATTTTNQDMYCKSTLNQITIAHLNG